MADSGSDPGDVADDEQRPRISPNRRAGFQPEAAPARPAVPSSSSSASSAHRFLSLATTSAREPEQLFHDPSSPPPATTAFQLSPSPRSPLPYPERRPGDHGRRRAGLSRRPRRVSATRRHPAIGEGTSEPDCARFDRVGRMAAVVGLGGAKRRRGTKVVVFVASLCSREPRQR